MNTSLMVMLDGTRSFLSVVLGGLVVLCVVLVSWFLLARWRRYRDLGPPRALQEYAEPTVSPYDLEMRWDIAVQSLQHVRVCPQCREWGWAQCEGGRIALAVLAQKNPRE